MALTLDGKIGKGPNHFPDWTEKADKVLFMHMTKEVGVLIMGSNSYDTIGKPLPNRKNIVMTRSTDRKSDQENLIFTNNPPQKILEDLKAEGHTEVILAGGAKINTLFAKENLIDEIVVTISPKLFGTGLDLFGDEVDMDLELLEMEKIGENTILTKYKVVK